MARADGGGLFSPGARVPSTASRSDPSKRIGFPSPRTPYCDRAEPFTEASEVWSIDGIQGETHYVPISFEAESFERFACFVAHGVEFEPAVA